MFFHIWPNFDLWYKLSKIEIKDHQSGYVPTKCPHLPKHAGETKVSTINFVLPSQNIAEFWILKWKMVFKSILADRHQKMKCMPCQDTPPCQVWVNSEKVWHGAGHVLWNLGTHPWDSHLEPRVRQQTHLCFHKLKV